MRYEFLDFQVLDGVAHVSLLGDYKPTLQVLFDEFLDMMLRLQEDRSVRVILITDGEGSFDMSPDLHSLAQERCDGSGFESLAPDLEIARKIITIIQETTKPVVAAARGGVRESGLGFFLATDVRCASTTATFKTPDMSRGLLPDWGLTFTLPRLIGPGRTLDLIWSNRTLSADEADRIGLVDHLIPDENWEEVLTSLVEKLCRLPQPAVQLTKLAVQQTSQFDMTSMLSFEYEAQHQCWQAFETAEGMAAFLDGRTPQFAVLAQEEEE